ncbi:UDP-glucose 4-epimerase GalE [Rhodobacterales bacterium]|nr:UDP-glucose 4-epimerase GalE [Rhodobacterales bacterium]
MTILITGGAGFIGSHCCVTFLEAGHDVVVLDNLTNANSESIERLKEITGRNIIFEHADIRDQDALELILRQHRCEAVIHFAGLKAVGESTQAPLLYYDNNVAGTVRLLSAMDNCGVRDLVFSSSATVYGDPKFLPLTEEHPLSAVNPYGRSKLIIEEMLRDLSASDPKWRFAILRYFNPVGAHESGLIGEDPLGIPNNLMPFIAQVATGRRENLSIFGNDYDTHDGTGVRDYIHVTDLVDGHLRAYEALKTRRKGDGCFAVNLGTGTGYSVLDMVRAFERASNKKIEYEFAPRRFGDVAACFAETSLAERIIGWKAQKGLDAMCRDTWNWVCKNPNGFSQPAE